MPARSSSATVDIEEALALLQSIRDVLEDPTRWCERGVRDRSGTLVQGAWLGQQARDADAFQRELLAEFMHQGERYGLVQWDVKRGELVSLRRGPASVELAAFTLSREAVTLIRRDRLYAGSRVELVLRLGVMPEGERVVWALSLLNFEGGLERVLTTLERATASLQRELDRRCGMPERQVETTPRDCDEEQIAAYLVEAIAEHYGTSGSSPSRRSLLVALRAFTRLLEQRETGAEP